MRKTAFFAGLLLAQGCTVQAYQFEDAWLDDAGPPDAGPSDSGPPDTGPHDAGRDTASACAAQDLGSVTGSSIAMGTTNGAGDRITPSCGPSGHPDAWFTWVAPSAGTWAITTDGSDFDTVLAVMSSCAGPEIDCNDDFGSGLQSGVQVALTAGQNVVIVIDGYETGHYVLNIDTIPPEICDDHIDNDGDFATDCEDSDCATFPACDEATHCSDHIDNDLDFETDCADSDCSSQMICLETGANCSDGIDNDLDGDIDCRDSDCGSLTMCSESMNCADTIDNDQDDLVDCADSDCAADAHCTTHETNCNDGLDDDFDGDVDCSDTDCAAHCGENTIALCTNTMDDDGDTLVDCADLQCSCTAACPPAVMPSATCPDMDLGMAVGDGVYHGTIAGYACGARADATCGTTHGLGAEVELAWTAPANGTYVFDTEDTSHAGGIFDTILTLRTQCGGDATSEFGCDDDGGSGHLSRVSHFLVMGEMIIVVIDAQNVWDGGNVTLNVHAM